MSPPLAIAEDLALIKAHAARKFAPPIYHNQETRPHKLRVVEFARIVGMAAFSCWIHLTYRRDSRGYIHRYDIVRARMNTPGAVKLQVFGAAVDDQAEHPTVRPRQVRRATGTLIRAGLLTPGFDELSRKCWADYRDGWVTIEACVWERMRRLPLMGGPRRGAGAVQGPFTAGSPGYRPPAAASQPSKKRRVYTPMRPREEAVLIRLPLPPAEPTRTGLGDRPERASIERVGKDQIRIPKKESGEGLRPQDSISTDTKGETMTLREADPEVDLPHVDPPDDMAPLDEDDPIAMAMAFMAKQSAKKKATPPKGAAASKANKPPAPAVDHSIGPMSAPVVWGAAADMARMLAQVSDAAPPPAPWNPPAAGLWAPRGEGCVFPPDPLCAVRAPRAPKMPQVLPAHDDDEVVATVLRAFRAVATKRSKKPCFVFARGMPQTHPLRPALIAAGRALGERRISPISWAAFSYDVWASIQPGAPPLRWVFLVSRIAAHEGWYRNQAASYAHERIHRNSTADELVGRYKRMVAGLRALRRPPTEAELKAAALQACPDWEGSIADARAETKTIETSLARAARRGQWVW